MMILQESMAVAALAWFLLIAPFDSCYLPGADVTAAGQTYNRIRCTDEKREKEKNNEISQYYKNSSLVSCGENEALKSRSTYVKPFHCG